jgi:hypothetical protein
MIISEQFVKNTIIGWLNKNNWRIISISEEGKHGVDIKARHTKYARYYFIETKGDPGKNVKYPDSRREVSFIQVLGQIILRIKSKSRDYYAIGLPISYSRKVFNRLPWQLSKKLILNVFLVDKDKKVRLITWKELKKHQ